jgi:hypothetical protein
VWNSRPTTELDKKSWIGMAGQRERPQPNRAGKQEEKQKSTFFLPAFLLSSLLKN